ncbi:hypothetical protein Acr_03g0014240 [Actinidia rufa]|uniref:Uncharacterized protein n=1 Tax=Actinidia rufa TaxID=165716 RepID=A0A7J0EE55_9ERIC|nr:hypothetical protein Acr_03g0014240 [Actinidia rufa]
MSFNTNLGGEESEQSLPSWISDHLGAKSYIDETTQSTSSPIPTSSRMDTSSLTKESNVMSQADLDNLGTTYSFPQGCLYSLSPLPDSGWYYFKARPEKKLAPRIPEQRKGVEDEVLFCLGDEWELAPGVAASESLLRVPRSWGTPVVTSCPSLFEVDAKRMEAVFGKIEPGGYFEVSKVLNSRTFKRHFAGGCSAFSTSGGDNTTSGDEGEFGTGEDSVEYLGVIRRGVGGAIRRALPGIPDETLLRWLGGSYVDPRQSRGRKGKEGGGAQASHQRGRYSRETGDQCSGACCRGGDLFPAGDGESQSMSDASVARRLLTGVIPESDKKEVDQLSENDLVAKSFHALGQLELVKAQKRAIKAETRVAELNEEKSRPGTEVDDLKTTVAELTSKLAKAKELAIEDFKASEEFKAAVTDSAATYFGDGFEFCKRQLLHQFPNLGADVANMAMDPSFAEEEDGDEGRRRTCIIFFF